MHPAVENLYKAKEILDELNLTFWLEAGTLLLAYRDGKVDETDTDICVFDIQTVLNNLHLFENVGFEVHKIYTHPSGLATELTLKRNNIKMDIWTREFRNGEGWWLSFDGDKYIPHHVDEKYFDTLGKLDIWGFEWNIPSSIEEYLEKIYGPNWRIPDPNWRWNTDPFCIDYDYPIEGPELAVIIKTFERENVLFRLIESIENIPRYHLYIADDSSKFSEEKEALYTRLTEQGHTIVRLPYDSGLPAGRNACMDLVTEDYILLLDDDFVIPKDFNISLAINKLRGNVGIVCGSLRTLVGDVAHYEHTLKIEKRRLYKLPPDNGIDLGLNFFVAKKEVFNDVRWDNRFKIGGEHLDFFLQLKGSKWKVLYEERFYAYHLQVENNTEYTIKRDRKDSWPIFADKWDIDGVQEHGGGFYDYREPW
ncbi:MAG: glycosyltransferase [Proteobacteria bacterium]|jgi:hypothetical protein|nr:glycosyltransferase [Pseudomonadota bacterium]